jgi:protein tyrosine/serine phosphatase
VRALTELRAAERDGPVLLHCMHGADRTGVVSALYRMSLQGWSKDAARQEMLHGGFGYHTMWRNIPGYLEEVDPAAIAAAMPR